MNKFITRAQELGKKAAELKQVVQSLPGHAAQIREAVTMTGGELKQLRADVQSNLHALRADSEDRLLGSMREINDHTAVFEEAGYELNGIELDLAVNQRLAVRLEKFEDVSIAVLRSLAARQTIETVRSIVNGIIKAEETAASIELSHLSYRGLDIHIGLVPMVRMCWVDAEPRREAPQIPPGLAVHTEKVVPQPPPTMQAATASMFELRPLPTGAIRLEAAAAPGPSNVHSKPTASEPVASWSNEALARFKKMPTGTKYSR